MFDRAPLVVLTRFGSRWLYSISDLAHRLADSLSETDRPGYVEAAPHDEIQPLIEEASTASEDTLDTAPAGPPAHWLERVQRGNPPQHWLDYVQSRMAESGEVWESSAIGQEMPENEQYVSDMPPESADDDLTYDAARLHSRLEGRQVEPAPGKPSIRDDVKALEESEVGEARRPEPLSRESDVAETAREGDVSASSPGVDAAAQLLDDRRIASNITSPAKRAEVRHSERIASNIENDPDDFESPAELGLYRAVDVSPVRTFQNTGTKSDFPRGQSAASSIDRGESDKDVSEGDVPKERTLSVPSPFPRHADFDVTLVTTDDETNMSYEGIADSREETSQEITHDVSVVERKPAPFRYRPVQRLMPTPRPREDDEDQKLESLGIPEVVSDSNVIGEVVRAEQVDQTLPQYKQEDEIGDVEAIEQDESKTAVLPQMTSEVVDADENEQPDTETLQSLPKRREPFFREARYHASQSLRLPRVGARLQAAHDSPEETRSDSSNEEHISERENEFPSPVVQNPARSPDYSNVQLTYTDHLTMPERVGEPQPLLENPRPRALTRYSHIEDFKAERKAVSQPYEWPEGNWPWLPSGYETQNNRERPHANSESHANEFNFYQQRILDDSLVVDAEHCWPTLPDNMFWHRGEQDSRREVLNRKRIRRLEDEQRGVLWNESPF